MIDKELNDLLAWAQGHTSGRGADMSARPLVERLITEYRNLRLRLDAIQADSNRAKEIDRREIENLESALRKYDWDDD